MSPKVIESLKNRKKLQNYPPFFQTKDFCDTMIKYFSAGTKNEGLGYLWKFVIIDTKSAFYFYIFSRHQTFSFLNIPPLKNLFRKLGNVLDPEYIMQDACLASFNAEFLIRIRT